MADEEKREGGFRSLPPIPLGLSAPISAPSPPVRVMSHLRARAAHSHFGGLLLGAPIMGAPLMGGLMTPVDSSASSETGTAPTTAGDFDASATATFDSPSTPTVDHISTEPVTLSSSGVRPGTFAGMSAVASAGEFAPSIDGVRIFGRSAQAAFDPAPTTPPNPPVLKAKLNDPAATSHNTPATPAPETVQLEARSQLAGNGRISAEAAIKKTAKARRSPRTTVGKSVIKNDADIELIGKSFIALIDSRIEELGQQRPNSDERRTAVESEIANYADLKRRVEAFLGAASQFSAKKVKETAVVNATTSFAEGIGNWWTKRHVQICDQAFQLGLFGIGVTICSLAGAGGMLSAAIPGAMLGGKPVADVVNACLKRDRS
jgi:hypothetical protein